MNANGAQRPSASADLAKHPAQADAPSAAPAARAAGSPGPPRRLILLPGLRILKTGIAVWLCIAIGLLRGPGALPFYSAIAAVLCMQADPKAGLKAGLNRMVGTLIGGLYGYGVTVLTIATGIRDHAWLNNSLIGLSVMPLIYLTVLIRQKHVAYLACVVSLSIALSHGGDPNPAAFALSRVIDTLIGVIVAVGINLVPFLKNRRIP